jgi:hypothetical protein
MIIKSALFFLRVLDVLWDAYEGLVGLVVVKLNNRKAITTPLI